MTSVSGLDRREWMQRALQVAVGAAVASSLPAATSTWTPQVLTSAQNDVLIATGERIIPGSAAALCNRIIDLVLTMESEKTRASLTRAIASFANDKDGAMLAGASREESPLHAQFLILKEWMAAAYWSSEPGLRELGWTGRMAWSAFPGCDVPGATNPKV